MSEDSVDTRLGRIEGKLDSLHDLFQQHLRAHLERSKTWITGVIAVCAAGLGWMANSLGGF